jgi:AcrR family transcriptional regulator
MDRSDPKRTQNDGRIRRSERTRQAIVEAYLDLLREKQKPPTAPVIARRAACSTRSVYHHFSGLHTLSLAAADDGLEQALAQAAVPNVDDDLRTRLKVQVETGATICERWLPLWRALLRHERESRKLAIRIKRIRAAMVARLEVAYSPELSTLSEAERIQLLVALEVLTDFESWGRMRESLGLSIEAARDIWINAIGRMLLSVTLKPERSRLAASGRRRVSREAGNLPSCPASADTAWRQAGERGSPSRIASAGRQGGAARS